MCMCSCSFLFHMKLLKLFREAYIMFYVHCDLSQHSNQVHFIRLDWIIELWVRTTILSSMFSHIPYKKYMLIVASLLIRFANLEMWKIILSWIVTNVDYWRLWCCNYKYVLVTLHTVFQALQAVQSYSTDKYSELLLFIDLLFSARILTAGIFKFGLLKE